MGQCPLAILGQGDRPARRLRQVERDGATGVTRRHHAVALARSDVAHLHDVAGVHVGRRPEAFDSRRGFPVQPQGRLQALAGDGFLWLPERQVRLRGPRWRTHEEQGDGGCAGSSKG